MGATSILGRILALVLVFILGFFACFGVLFAGGYLAYAKLTLDDLGVDTDSILSSDAPVDLTALSLAEIIEEFAALEKNSLSLDLLMTRYGLILPKEVDEFLTKELKTMALSKVFSKDGANEVMEEIYFGKLFGYERKENPAYDPANPDEDEPELIWVDPETDRRVVGVNGEISNITLAQFLKDGIPTQDILDSLTIGELMELKSKADLPIYIEDDLGDLVLVEDIDPIVIWYDRNGEEVATVIGALANQGIDDLNNEFADIELGQVLGTVEYKGEVYTYDVKRTSQECIVLTPAESVVSQIADLSIEGLSGKELNDRVNNMEVASLLDYKKDPVTGKWMDSENREVNSIMAQLAASTVGTINETIDGICFGEIAELVAVDANGDVVENPGSYTGVMTWYEKGYVKGAAGNVVATGVIASLADLSVSEMSDESALTEALKDVGVGDAMGYVKVGNTWYTDDTETTKASNIMAILADCKVGGLNERVGTITFSEIAGIEKVYYLKSTGARVPESQIGNYAESQLSVVWEDKDGKKASGLMAGLAHLSVDDFADEDAVKNAVQDITVGDAMGYEKVDGVWYTEYDPNDTSKNRLTGLVRAIADDRVGAMDEHAKTITIAEIADLKAVDSAGNVLEDVDAKTYNGVWYEEYYGKNHPNNKPTTGLMAGIAHLTMEEFRDSSSVKDAVGDIKAGDAMGYKKIGQVWYDDNDRPLTGLVKAIADSPVKDLNEDIQKTQFGTVAGLTYDRGVWMDGNNPATGIVASLADLTVAQISDEQALSDAVQSVTVADAMGYVKSGNGYKDKNNATVTGFMAVIADKKISEIENTLDTTEIGEFMGYQKVGTVWKKNGVAVDALMQKVCSRTINGLDGLMDTLVLKDVVEDYDTGIFSFVDENTKVTELGDAFETVFTDEANGVTMGELQAKGLIAADINLTTKVNGVTVSDMTFAEFIKVSNNALSRVSG